MNKETAQYISDLMLEFGEKLNKSVAVVQSDENSENFESYRLSVGRIMGTMLTEIMNPLYENHPDVKPDGLK